MRYAFLFLFLLAGFKNYAQRSASFPMGGHMNYSKGFAPKAEFIGGEAGLTKFIDEKINLSQEDIAGIKKSAWVAFTVNTTGDLSNLMIERSCGNKKVDEKIIYAFQLMSKSMWKPCVVGGHSVVSDYSRLVNLKHLHQRSRSNSEQTSQRIEP